MAQDKGIVTILVVEDEKDILDLVKMWLDGRGYRVVVARDGYEAVEIARRECPNVVLMDMSMPGLDGLTATKMIHEIEELCDVPVIACSANDVQEWKSKALRAGCDDFISKPINFERFDEVMARYRS